jgi:hypothetical protein
MTVASGWYASGTFWAAAGVIVAIVTGSALAIITYMAAFPKRRLLYSMPVVAPIAAKSEGIRAELELLYDGTKIGDPHVVEIQLVSRGRKDIPSSAYDRGEPVRLTINVPVLKVLDQISEPSSLSPPRLAVEGNTLKIGPDLIGRRQRIKITLLTDGHPSALKCASSLIDVKMNDRFMPDDEWILENRLKLGCVSWPPAYIAFGFAWALAGPTVALIVLLASSILIRLALLGVVALRRSTLRLSDT